MRRSDASAARRMFSADRNVSLGQSLIEPYSLAASTVRSRRPPPCANQRPRMFSVAPSPCFQPYTLAVSEKLMPCSCALSMIAKLSSSDVSGPKFMVPSTRRDTDRPLRPRCVYSMIANLRPELLQDGIETDEPDVHPRARHRRLRARRGAP